MMCNGSRPYSSMVLGRRTGGAMTPCRSGGFGVQSMIGDKHT